MAWARPPDAPTLPSCPLEALEPRENQYTPLSDKFGIPLIFGLAGVLGPALNNYMRKRPPYTGIWVHFTLGIGLTYVGKLITDVRKEMFDERDDILRQYIALHPEDFPPYEKRLLKDIVEPWTPLR